MTRHHYTDEERAYIAASYATMSRAEIAQKLGLPEVSIKLFIQRNKHIRKGTPKSCFKKGSAPWNTGIKGYVRKKSPADFKPGLVPHNATNYYDGMVVVRHKADEKYAYKFRRLAKGRWVLSHRYNWQQANGPIPKGYCLKCRTENTLDDQPENWELVSRQALAVANGIWQQCRAADQLTPAYLAATLTRNQPELRKAVLASPELLDTQRLKITLNRLIACPGKPN